MKLEVEYSINEGLSFWNGNCGILLDYIFDNEVTAWSDMPDICRHRMLTKSREFARNHFLLFSHGHCDHYSKAYMKEYLENYPARVFGIGIAESNLLVECPEPGVSLLELEGYRVVIIETAHQGTGTASEIQNSLVCIGSGNDWYVQLGDSILTDQILKQMSRYGVYRPEAMFVNLYQIVPQAQRRLLQQIGARNVFCVHYPFKQNDEYGIYRQLTSFITKAPDPFLKTMIVPMPMSRLM